LANGLRPLLWPNQSTTGLSTVSSVSTILKLEPPCERPCSALVRPLGWSARHLRSRPAQRRFIPRYFINYLCRLKRGCSTWSRYRACHAWSMTIFKYLLVTRVLLGICVDLPYAQCVCVCACVVCGVSLYLSSDTTAYTRCIEPFKKYLEPPHPS